MEGSREHGSNLPGIQPRDQGYLRVGVLPGLLIVRVQERHTRADDQFGLCQVGWQLAEMLDPEGRRERLSDIWQSNLFMCLPASGLKGRLGQRVRFACLFAG